MIRGVGAGELEIKLSIAAQLSMVAVRSADFGDVDQSNCKLVGKQARILLLDHVIAFAGAPFQCSAVQHCNMPATVFN